MNTLPVSQDSILFVVKITIVLKLFLVYIILVDSDI